MKKGIYFILFASGIILQAAAGGGGAAGHENQYLPSQIGMVEVLKIFEETVFNLYRYYRDRNP
jgi:hypothetical protein